MSFADAPPQPEKPDQPSAKTAGLASSYANRTSTSETGATKASKAPEVVHYRGTDDIEPNVDDVEPDARSSQDYVAILDKFNRDKNKENWPSPHHPQASAGKQSMPDRQKSASHDPHYSSTSSSNKRQRHGESEDGQDEGFQADRRAPNPLRRTAAPVPQHHPSIQRAQSPPQMIRSELRDDRSAEAGRHNVEQLLTGDDNWVEEEEEEDEDEDEDNASSVPAPQYAEITTAARFAVDHGERRPTQQRTPWSDADSERLRDLIGELGTSWVNIDKQGDFEVQRGQVALKDRARNMKVMYLR